MRARRHVALPTALAVAAWAAGLPGRASASDPGPVAGSLGASLGAGAAAGEDRRAAGRNPAALMPSRRGFLLHAHRPFGLGELLVAEAGASWDGKRGGWGATWRQIGAGDLYLAHALEIQGARRIGRLPGFLPGSLDLGSALSAVRRGVAGRETAWDYRHGHGAVWRPAPSLAVGAFARDLSFPFGGRAGGEAGGIGQVGQVGLEARSPRSGGRAAQSLRFDFRKTGGGPWRPLASLSVSPHPACEVSAGLSAAPFRFSLGMRVAWGGLSAWQAFRHHGALGPTWLSSLGWEDGAGIDNPAP